MSVLRSSNMDADEFEPQQTTFKLDAALLEDVGLQRLVAEEANLMLAHIYETLELRVGMRFAEEMSDEQLDEFESYIDADDEAGALRWLETNFPDYKSTVRDELEALKIELRQLAPTILALSGAF
jgi:hypothetical protein